MSAMSLDWFKRGNGVLGIRREEHNKWERRAPLTPGHCARLLHSGRVGGGVDRIVVQPCTKRIHSDQQYEEVGCEISEDLADCGFILGVKRPQLGSLLPDRGYAFFSHTHKAQPENMPLLDEVLEKRVSLYDFELIVGDNGERLVAFGEYAGRAGMIDFLRVLGERFLSLGFSTPFLSLGSSYMYTSLIAAKAAVLAVGDEISTTGLPLGICPLVFVFTGSGNVSRGAQEIFRLLPHKFVKPSELPQVYDNPSKFYPNARKDRSDLQIYGCVVESCHMVVPNDPAKEFDKSEYYAHPEHYHSIFHEKIAPYTSVIVNCMYWERRFPRLLTNKQLKELPSTDKSTDSPVKRGRLLGVADITCDVQGSIESLHQATPIEQPFFRYNASSSSYHTDMDGEGIIFLAVDCLPTELAKESTKHFGDVLLPFISSMVRARTPEDMLRPIKRACIAHDGQLTHLYEYINRMRLTGVESSTTTKLDPKKNGCLTRLVSLNGHLFDKFLINEALDVICAAGGRFHLATCEVGQTDEEISHADLVVEADNEEQLGRIVDSLAAVASHNEEHLCNEGLSTENRSYETPRPRTNRCPVMGCNKLLQVLILGAGRVCEPAVKYLALHGSHQIRPSNKDESGAEFEVHVVVASLYLEDAQKVTAGIPNASPIELDIADSEQLRACISKATVVISLLPPDCHVPIATACIELKKHLVTASYVSSDMAALDERAKAAKIAILCEMGLDPGIDHMMAMQMIDSAHARGGHVQSFVSYCGGLPSPMAANNPLGYKFSWNPSGAIKAGRNPAIYKQEGKVLEIAGEDLFSSAVRLRLPNLPAFALEMLPNRDSLKYGEYYGIAEEATTIFRATLRYEGFSELMDGIAKLRFFSFDNHPLLTTKEEDGAAPNQRITFEMYLEYTLAQLSQAVESKQNETVIEKLVSLGCSPDIGTAKRLWHCVRWLGLNSKQEIPKSCKSAFDILCYCMEAKLTFSPNEQDLVLLHHELEVAYDDGRSAERYTATLLALGEAADGTSPGAPQTAMARTVGLTAAIGAQLLLSNEVKSRGVLRPLRREVYDPALKILAAQGMQLEEHSEVL